MSHMSHENDVITIFKGKMLRAFVAWWIPA